MDNHCGITVTLASLRSHSSKAQQLESGAILFPVPFAKLHVRAGCHSVPMVKPICLAWIIVHGAELVTVHSTSTFS